MKKFMSVLAASVMAVSALSVFSASAAVEENFLSINTEVITEAFTTTDGTVIPAGTTAVTLNISDNTGFDSFTTKLNIGSAELIVDEDGTPVYTAGDVLENAMVASATNNGLVSVVSASSEEIDFDGELITFYISSGFVGASILDEDLESFTGYAASPASTLISYTIGDVNQDGAIDAVDASGILHAIDVYKNDYKISSRPNLTVSFANLHKSEMLPYASTAEAADADINDVINDTDAENVLDYYSQKSVGITNPHVAHVGELKYKII
jgi:hypothetical protein